MRTLIVRTHALRASPAPPPARHAVPSKRGMMVLAAAQAHEPLSHAVAAATAIAASLLLSDSALAESLPTSEIFQSKCAGCHMNGGNVVQPGATLSQADLAKNGVDSPEALYNIIYAGKNKMPGYGIDCAPKGKCTFGPRLSDKEITSLASYIKERAAANWQ